MSASWAIETENLTKTFPGGQVAVSGLDLAIPSGTVYGLVGRNGAGKSTALRLLLGLLKPNQGRVRVLGCDMWKADREVRASIGYVSQHQQLPGGMSLNDLGRYVGHFYVDWNPNQLRQRAEAWGIDPFRSVGKLSGGEQRKAALLLALNSAPRVLLLDEPANGLDSIARRELLALLMELVERGPETTLLISTHHVADLGRIALEVGLMERGRLQRSARLEDLQRNVRKVQIIFDGDEVPAAFKMAGALRSEVAGPVLTTVCEIESEASLDALRAIPGARVQVFPLGLEEIFVELFESRAKKNVSQAVSDEEDSEEKVHV